MSTLRALVRLGLAVAWTLVVAPLPGVVAILCLGNRRATWWAASHAVTAWAGGVCRVSGIRVRVEGAPSPGPVLVAANHVGYLDILVLGSLAPTFFVSKADIAGWPVIGVIARLGGTLFIERARRTDAARVAGAIERRLAGGYRVVAFLEGRAGPGDRVLPFRSSLVAAAVWTGAPCQPVAVAYRLPGARDYDPCTVLAWPEGVGLLPHVWRLLRHPCVEARVDLLPVRVGGSRKALAADLESDVREAHTRLLARIVHDDSRT